jgi:hypothetical protein
MLTLSGALTGYVCELSIEDTRAVTLSGQINGTVWLTYPHNTSSMPFLTVPIFPEYARLYLETRPHLM